MHFFCRSERRYFPSFSSAFSTLILSSALLGCLPTLPRSESYVHEMTYMVNGVTYRKLTPVVCTSSHLVLSAADGKYHSRWGVIGYDKNAAVALPGGMVMVYPVDAKCEVDSVDIYPYATIFDGKGRPSRIVVVNGPEAINWGGMKFQIVRQASRRRSPEEALTSLDSNRPDISAYLDQDYEMMKVTVHAASSWGGTPEAQFLFSGYKRLTLAEDRQGDGSSYFPVRLNASAANQTGTTESFWIFENGAFSAPSDPNPCPSRGCWSAVGKKFEGIRYPHESGTRLVRYKGIDIEVKHALQVFDPETQELITFSRSIRLW